MPERETRENFITRVNNSPTLKIILPMLVGGTVGIIEGNFGAQQIFDKRFYAGGMGASWTILEAKIKEFGGDPESPFLLKSDLRGTLLRASLFASLIQQPQLITGGNFDPKIYIPLALGVGGGWLLEKSAKALYNSGLTKPIYRILRIRERRLTTV